MTTQNKPPSGSNALNEAIEQMMRNSQAIAERIIAAVTVSGESVAPALYEFVERGTETVGKVVTPIAESPLVKFATKVPGISWLMAAMGQVDVATVQREVAELQQKYPHDTAQQLAQRVMADTAWKAAGVGLVTNLIPPFALMLFAVDLGAIAALQAEMTYRIAAIYGFSPTDPTRRGEVLTLWGVFTGGSGVMKTGLSVVELIPALGTLVGTAGDATLVYSMGYLACMFYEEKRRSGK